MHDSGYSEYVIFKVGTQMRMNRHPPTMLGQCPKFDGMIFLTASLTSFLRVSYNYLLSILQVSYKFLTSFLQVSYKFLKSLLQVSYKSLTSLLLSYQLLTSLREIKVMGHKSWSVGYWSRDRGHGEGFMV